jgi:hypothetical protein
LARGAATLSGKRIKVAPGMYTDKTLEFDAVPASTVTITAADPSNPPKFNIMRYGRRAAGKPFSNVTLENIDCVTNDWSLVTKPAVALDNVDNVTWRGCRFYGGYRGNLSVPFDVTKDDYPELASIYPQFNDSGVITSLVINNYPDCYVGDLKADGTWPLVFATTANREFTVLPTANFTVSGGYITGTSDLVGGVAVQVVVAQVAQRRLERVTGFFEQNCTEHRAPLAGLRRKSAFCHRRALPRPAALSADVGR